MHCHMQMKTLFQNSPTNCNWMYDIDWNLSGRQVYFSFETNKITLTFKNDRRKVDRSNHYVYPPCRVFVVLITVSVCRYKRKLLLPRFVQEKPRRLFCKSILFDESED